MPYLIPQNIIISISSFLSLVGSSSLIYTILRSEKKLTVPYRRFIFGISIFDIFSSAGFFTTIFLAPKGITLLSIENTTTCDIQGFVLALGLVAVPIYLLSLCIYYFCTIRLNMRTQRLKRIEPFLHGTPIFYSVTCNIYALAKGYINNNNNNITGICYVGASPLYCDMVPDQECIRGEGATKFRFIFISAPIMIIFVVICGMMAVIAYSAMKIEKRNRRYLAPYSSSGEESTIRSISARGLIQLLSSIFRSIRPSTDNENEEDKIEVEEAPAPPTIPCPRQKSLELSTWRTRETKKQALYYVGAFVLTYVFTWIQSIYVLVTGKPPLVALHYLTPAFLPLQGFMNVFVYCRPHIGSLRRKYPGEYTWFQAFKIVLKSGGDSCQATVDAERRQQENIVVERRLGRRVEDSSLIEDTSFSHSSHPSSPVPVHQK